MSYNLKQNADGTAELVESNSADAAIKMDLVPVMTAGTGITSGTGTVYKSGIIQHGEVKKIQILIDLTGLDSDATLGDIIGVSGTALPCHIGQIPAGIGTIFGGTMTCLKAPATGEVDIDVYSATEGTGVTDGAIGDLTETALLAAAADWTIGAVKPFTAFPAASSYLYLTVGTSSTPTAATYTAGKFLIELLGY